jgi:predicted site-specific integrase-resolvase
MKKIEGIIMYDVSDLCRKLGITWFTAERYLRAGRLRGVKINRAWYVSAENLKEFLQGGTGPRKVETEKLKKRKKATEK